jgi:5-formyltetrahydrofolate cyclo-ligase
MAKKRQLRQGLDELRDGLRRVGDAVRAAGEEGAATNINHAGQANIVVTSGMDGEAASSHQTTHIRQRNGETVEETTTTSRSTVARPSEH